jgi:hypothetical protein
MLYNAYCQYILYTAYLDEADSSLKCNSVKTAGFSLLVAG